MASIPPYRVLRDYFSSEDNAVEYLIKKFNQHHIINEDDHSDSIDQPESVHPDTNESESGSITRQSNYSENNHLNQNISMNKTLENSNELMKAEKSFDYIPIATNKLETSTKAIMYHALNLTDSIAYKQSLTSRTKLPCHHLLYISHLWLANCSKDSIALLVGVDVQLINEWIGYCIRTICDKIEKDIDFLSPDERILIAERMWRRKYRDRLWEALLEIAFQPFHTRSLTKGDNIVTKESDDPLALFESMGLKERLLDGIAAFGISEPTEIRKVKHILLLISMVVIVFYIESDPYDNLWTQRCR